MLVDNLVGILCVQVAGRGGLTSTSTAKASILVAAIAAVSVAAIVGLAVGHKIVALVVLGNGLVWVGIGSQAIPSSSLTVGGSWCMTIMGDRLALICPMKLSHDGGT